LAAQTHWVQRNGKSFSLQRRERLKRRLFFRTIYLARRKVGELCGEKKESTWLISTKKKDAALVKVVEESANFRVSHFCKKREEGEVLEQKGETRPSKLTKKIEDLVKKKRERKTEES